jgi:hypothetical protein
MPVFDIGKCDDSSEAIPGAKLTSRLLPESDFVGVEFDRVAVLRLDCAGSDWDLESLLDGLGNRLNLEAIKIK